MKQGVAAAMAMGDAPPMPSHEGGVSYPADRRDVPRRVRRQRLADVPAQHAEPDGRAGLVRRSRATKNTGARIGLAGEYLRNVGGVIPPPYYFYSGVSEPERSESTGRRCRAATRRRAPGIADQMSNIGRRRTARGRARRSPDSRLVEQQPSLPVLQSAVGVEGR